MLAYSDLMRLLEHLDIDNEHIIRNSKTCREYVVYSMFLHGWECANRFMLAANVAKILGKNELRVLYENDCNLNRKVKYNKSLRFFGRYLASNERLFKRNSKHPQEDYPFDVLNYSYALTTIQELRLLMEDCDEQEAAALIPVLRSVISVIRNKDATPIK